MKHFQSFLVNDEYILPYNTTSRQPEHSRPTITNVQRLPVQMPEQELKVHDENFRTNNPTAAI